MDESQIKINLIVSRMEFYKYQGTGNDFIIVDNRRAEHSLPSEQIRRMCHRRFGIGADGLMLMNDTPDYDFEMKYYNADGKEGSMCGNGGRCMIQFAFHMGIQKELYRFIAVDGEHSAVFDNNGWIHLKMNDVNKVTRADGDYILDTGSPHYVKITTNVMQRNVVEKGREIRNSKAFAKEGINVNFVEVEDDYITVRTYERGVEEETLSCGTGVTASALMCAHNDRGFNRVTVKTPGGTLAVEFEKHDDKQFSDIWLCGPAVFVFRGVWQDQMQN